MEGTFTQTAQSTAQPTELTKETMTAQCDTIAKSLDLPHVQVRSIELYRDFITEAAPDYLNLAPTSKVYDEDCFKALISMNAQLAARLDSISARTNLNTDQFGEVVNHMRKLHGVVDELARQHNPEILEQRILSMERTQSIILTLLTTRLPIRRIDDQ